MNRWFVVALLLGVLSPAFLKAQIANPSVNTALSESEQKAVTEFQSRIGAYADLRKHMPPDAHLKPTKDLNELEHRRHELRERIRKARPNAKQGDVFRVDVATVFKRLLHHAFDGPDGVKIRTSLAHAEPGPSKALRVDRAFPNQQGEPTQSSPPSLLKDLPLLPQGIEYRLVGNTLVLRDAEANLVIDYLPNAVS